MRRVLLPVLFLLVLAMAASGEDNSIIASLSYNAGSSFDTDNNGIEPAGSVIDFSVASTQFSWPANESNLCTRWHIIPEDSEVSTLLCYGSGQCCSLVELYPSSESWNDPFYLSPEIYSVGQQNSVGAQVIYAEYSYDSSSSVDVSYSDFSYLPATFIEEGLSSQSVASVSVTSPSNASALQSGEGITLAVTVDATATGKYSLDSSANATLSANAISGGTNLTAALFGILPGGVLNNSDHLLRVYISTSSENITLEHPFSVNDASPPTISLANLSNTTVVVSTGELANFSYSLNNVSYSKALNSSNAALVILNVSNGLNNLTLFASDMHGNSNSVSHVINATIESCTDSVQNYHDGQMEAGVDCGGSCSSCVNLSVSTDKSSYLVGELVYIQVGARSDTKHNITVTGPGYQTSLSYNGSTYYIISPPSAGAYSINVSLKYRNLPLEFVTASFAVNSTSASNPLTASISDNASAISVNDIVEFSASVGGNTSAVQYSWDFNNDSVADATTMKVNHTYAAPGSYRVNLTVKDGTWNITATREITVYPYYNISVRVRDRTTDAEITAIVMLNAALGTSPYTASLRRGSYPLTANYSGYFNYSSTLSVNSNESLILYLTTNSVPSVTLVSPENGSTVTTSTDMVFEVSRIPLTCTLFAGSGALGQVSREVVNETPYTFHAELGNGTFSWKVSCVDNAGNLGESETRSFTFSQLSERDEAIRAEIQGMIDTVDSSLSQVDSLGKDAKEVANAINYRRLLENSKFELQRSYRDIFNIKWRRLNFTDEENFRSEIVNRVELVKGNLTTNISVLRSAEFVSYPKDSTVKEVSDEYSRGTLYTKAELDSYLAGNIELQKAVSVTTKYTNVELTKYNGAVIHGTLIERRLSYDNISGSAVVEFIPKSIANSVADIEVYAIFKVIKDDPIIEVEPVGKSYAFLVKESLTPVEVQGIETVVVHRSVPTLSRKKSGITGLAIFDSSGLSSGSAIIAEILVLVILAGLYVFYGTGMRESSGVKEIRSIMKKAIALTADDFEQSERHYTDISAIFRKLEKKEKAAIYASLSDLGGKIRHDHVLNKLREANILLSHGQRQAAISVYHSISELYKSLPEHHRRKLYTHCSGFHRKLSEKK